MNGPAKRKLVQYSMAHINAPGNLTSKSGWITTEFPKKHWMENSMEEACGETTTQMGRGWRGLAGDRELLKRPWPTAGYGDTEEK